MMTQDGGFFFKKERKIKKHNPTNHNPNPSVPSPPTSWSFFAPFTRLVFHQHELPRENQTPAALHAHPAHRCQVTNQLAPTVAGVRVEGGQAEVG